MTFLNTEVKEKWKKYVKICLRLKEIWKFGFHEFYKEVNDRHGNTNRASCISLPKEILVCKILYFFEFKLDLRTHVCRIVTIWLIKAISRLTVSHVLEAFCTVFPLAVF